MRKPSDLEFSYRLIRDRIIGLKDRTVRKSYYPQLRQRLGELERFRFLLDHIQEMLFVFTIPDGRLLDFNRPVLDATGYESQKLREMTIRDIFLRLEPLEKMAAAQPNSPGAFPDRATLITHYRNADGGETPVELTLETAVFGKSVYGIIVARDIRERLEVERTRRSLTDRLNTLIEAIPDRIAFKDVDGKYLVVNRAFAESLALSAKRIIGRKDPLLPSTPPFGTQVVTDQEVMAESRPYQFEICEQSPDGTTRYFDAIKVPLKDHQGRSMGLVHISRDITDRKRTDEEKKHLGKQLRQAQKMEAVGTLAGGIAHDFNNILSAVLGYTEMAIEDTPADSFIRQNMEQVLQAGIRAKELVQQILTFSRQREQELRPIQPERIIKEAVRLLRASLPATITIDQEISSQSSILSDATQFHQVLMNLATNAAHAMREKGGTLAIGLADIDVDKQMRHQIPEISPGPYLRMTVADDGVGIPSAILDRIYDPFFTTKPQGVGTGMGLSVVHGIVKSHRGVIEVASTTGKGTEFRVYFPRVETGEVLNTPRVENIPGGSEHILFVDDEDILVEMSSHLLKRLGYEVTACTNSMDALDRFQEAPERFALVITDMTMPEMTGKELATRILALRPGLPIIMCTGFSEQISEEKAKQIGIRAFIMKPIVVNHLAKTIRRVLDAPSPGRAPGGDRPD